MSWAIFCLFVLVEFFKEENTLLRHCLYISESQLLEPYMVMQYQKNKNVLDLKKIFSQDIY